MRAALLVLSFLCVTCTLVVDGRIAEYEGACADEEENVRHLYGSADRRRSVAKIADDCHGQCTGEDCVEDCITNDTNGAISLECAACFADAADCVATFCAVPCAGDLVDVGCLVCACNRGCAPALDGCAGFTVEACPEPL